MAASIDGATAQSVRIAFRFLTLAAIVVCLGWLCSGITQVEPAHRAVISRFGRIDRDVASGLVLAWPRPIEQVVMVPAHETQLKLVVQRLMPAAQADTASDGYVLTGDNGVAYLDGSVYYVVADPEAYVLMQDRVPQALERLFCAAAIACCSHRTLDQVLVASPGVTEAKAAAPGDAADAAGQRERLRTEIVAGINQRSRALGLGIEATRVDLSASLPPKAQEAFIAVATAEADANTLSANAETDAETTAQTAEQECASIRGTAQGEANQLIADAHTATDQIAAIFAASSPQQRQQLMQRLYRDRIEGILARATVTLVDRTQPVHLAIQGE